MSAIAHSVTTHAPYTARPGRGSLLRAVSAWFIGSNKTQLPKTMPTSVAPVTATRMTTSHGPAVLQLSESKAAELSAALALSKTVMQANLRAYRSGGVLIRREQSNRPAATQTPERDYPIV